jgi:hypothetical protein
MIDVFEWVFEAKAVWVTWTMNSASFRIFMYMSLDNMDQLLDSSNIWKLQCEIYGNCSVIGIVFGNCQTGFFNAL